MSELQTLQFNLIDAIMRSSDVEQLRGLYDQVRPKVNPSPHISVEEVGPAPSLTEVRAGQTVEKRSFREHMKLVGDEPWGNGLTLIKLLETLE